MASPLAPFSPSSRSSSSSANVSERSKIEQLAQKIFESSGQGIEPKSLQERVLNLQPDCLLQLLGFMAEKIRTADNSGEWIETCFQLIPESLLNQACSLDNSKESAEALLQTARRFLEIVQKQPPSSWKVHWEAFLDVCVSVLEGFVSAFGIEGFFSPSESKFDSDMKGGRIMQLSALFGTLSAMLTPLLGASMATASVGGMILSATCLSLIFPYIRPKPSRLLLASNWTKEIREGTLAPPLGRKKTLDQIAFSLVSSGGAKTYPMLIGKTGAGKTATAQAFAEAVERGDFPGLQGKTVFYLNTGDLRGADVLTGRNPALDNIKKTLGNHLENAILVFDEIHQACQETNGTACKLGEQLKTRLHCQAGGFPLVIGITTEEEFFRDIYRQNPALARRFQKIAIEDPTIEQQLEILTHAVLQNAPQAALDLKILKTLIDKTKESFPNFPEPITSLRILSLCIALVTDFQKSGLLEKKEELESELNSLALLNALELDDKRIQRMQEIHQELEKLKPSLENEEQERSEFLKLQTQMVETKKAFFQAVAEKKAPPAALYFWRRFLLEPQKKQILNEAQRLGIKALIDESLIDAVIQQELENEEKLKQILAAGKDQAEMRELLV